jgi:hypothetical protein
MTLGPHPLLDRLRAATANEYIGENVIGSPTDDECDATRRV